MTWRWHRPISGCAAALLAVWLGAGCEQEPPPPPPSRLDGSVRRDAGPGMDARVIIRTDGGNDGPTIDGVLDDDPWEDAVIVEADVETDVAGSTLRRLMLFTVDSVLYIGVDADLAPGHTLAIYLDRDRSGSDGVVDLESLDDDDGAFDIALSTDLSAPIGFRADFALGTRLMSHAATGLDDSAGFRELPLEGEDPAFTVVPADEAPFVCGEDACEAAISFERLGLEAPARVAAFARILSDEPAWTNQTLPEDSAVAPDNVTVALEIDVGDLADGGISSDGGGFGIVVDGIVGASEWAGTTQHVSSTVASGTFTGNALRSLRTHRDSTRLYVAIEGTLLSGNAITMYVDRAVSQIDGIVSPSNLEDFGGELDSALSRVLITPAEFLVDFAFGVLDMNRAAIAGDDRMGWRNVGTDPFSFSNVPSITQCSANACETAVLLSALGTGPTDEIGLFVRLVSAGTAAVSNQTLPMDSDPSITTNYASVPR